MNAMRLAQTILAKVFFQDLNKFDQNVLVYHTEEVKEVYPVFNFPFDR